MTQECLRLNLIDRPPTSIGLEQCIVGTKNTNSIESRPEFFFLFFPPLVWIFGSVNHSLNPTNILQSAMCVYNENLVQTSSQIESHAMSSVMLVSTGPITRPSFHVYACTKSLRSTKETKIGTTVQTHKARDTGYLFSTYYLLLTT